MKKKVKKKKQTRKPDLGRVNSDRKYKIGTLFKTSLGPVFKYVKIDLGSAGRIGDRDYRIIIYRWIQWRQM